MQMNEYEKAVDWYDLAIDNTEDYLTSLENKESSNESIMRLMRQDKHDTRHILALRLFQKCRSSIAILESLVPNRKFLDKRFIHYVSELKKVDKSSFGVSIKSSSGYQHKMIELDKNYHENFLKVE